MIAVLSNRALGRSAEYAARQREILDGIELGAARVRARQVAAEKPQLTAFLDLPGTTSKEDLQKLCDLGRWAGRTAHLHERAILADPGKRRKKLAIETGWDDRYDDVMRAPLEPWTCPAPNAAMALYGEIMRAPDGAFSIGDFRGSQLSHVEYMRREELLSVGGDGRLHALSDMAREAGRAYPGAPVPDSCRRVNGAHTCASENPCASFGRQLRDRATGKVLAALFNISRGGVVRWSRKRDQRVIEAPGGLRLSAAQVCAEANQLIAADVGLMAPDPARGKPDRYRFLSVSTCREILKALIELGYITEAIGAKAIRRMRSWFTLPRVIGRVMEDLSARADILAAVSRWRKQA